MKLSIILGWYISLIGCSSWTRPILKQIPLTILRFYHLHHHLCKTRYRNPTLVLVFGTCAGTAITCTPDAVLQYPASGMCQASMRTAAMDGRYYDKQSWTKRLHQNWLKRRRSGNQRSRQRYVLKRIRSGARYLPQIWFNIHHDLVPCCWDSSYQVAAGPLLKRIDQPLRHKRCTDTGNSVRNAEYRGSIIPWWRAHDDHRPRMSPL